MTWRSVALAVITIAVTAATVLWFVARQPPKWWSPPAASDPQVRQLAERVEYRLVQEAHRARPAGDSWRLRITEEQINAWLAARLAEWFAHQRDLDWPDELSPPQVQIEPAGVIVGCSVGGDGRSRFMAARILTAFAEDGVRLRVERLWHGRLPIPGDPISIIRKTLAEHGGARFLQDPQTRRWLGILEGAEPVDPLIRLTDGRRIRLLGIEREADAIIVEGATLAP